MQQAIELNIAPTYDQEDHKIEKLAKEWLSQLNRAMGSLTLFRNPPASLSLPREGS